MVLLFTLKNMNRSTTKGRKRRNLALSLERDEQLSKQGRNGMETKHKHKHKTQNTKHKTQNTKHKTQNTKHKTQNTKHKTQTIGTEWNHPHPQLQPTPPQLTPYRIGKKSKRLKVKT
jgi:hypothetical protein